MVAEIITIGDEILIGQVVDTNSAWMAEQLNLNGIRVNQIISINDTREHILSTLKAANRNADLVLITGGLGPTKDDITKKVLCEYFNTGLVFNEEAFKNVERLFRLRNIEITGVNRQQAMVPEGCRVLSNLYGTAPGLWLEKDSTVFVFMPGIPYEMQAMMEKQVIPMIKDLFNINTAIYHKTVLTQGTFEARLSAMLEDWEKEAEAKDIKLAYLPQPGIVRLRMSAYGKDLQKLKADIDDMVKKLEARIPQYIYGYDKDTVEEVTGKVLGENNKTVATAESCTGGSIAQLITSVPGSSEYFTGSVIAYSNEIKENILKVKQNSLIKYGAVSSQVVEEMAEGVMRLYNTDYAVATSGIAGPAGGTEEKPVGTTWVAVCSAKKTVSEQFLFGEHRGRNIRKAALTGLNMLRKLVMEENKNQSAVVSQQ